MLAQTRPNAHQLRNSGLLSADNGPLTRSYDRRSTLRHLAVGNTWGIALNPRPARISRPSLRFSIGGGAPSVTVPTSTASTATLPADQRRPGRGSGAVTAGRPRAPTGNERTRQQRLHVTPPTVLGDPGVPLDGVVAGRRGRQPPGPQSCPGDEARLLGAHGILLAGERATTTSVLTGDDPTPWTGALLSHQETGATDRPCPPKSPGDSRYASSLPSP